MDGDGGKKRKKASSRFRSIRNAMHSNKVTNSTTGHCGYMSCHQTYRDLDSPCLQISEKKLNRYNNMVEQSLGTCILEIMNLSRPHKLSFECNNLTLPSLDACLDFQMIEFKEHVNLVDEQSSQCVLDMSDLLEEYKDVYAGLDCLPGEYEVVLEQNCKPVQNRPR